MVPAIVNGFVNVRVPAQRSVPYRSIYGSTYKYYIYSIMLHALQIEIKVRVGVFTLLR